jgi:hypothetical protein
MHRADLNGADVERGGDAGRERSAVAGDRSRAAKKPSAKTTTATPTQPSRKTNDPHY